MGLRILHSADWHLETPFTDEAKRYILKRAQKNLPGKITELCRREKCDLMLLAGDIFDTKPSRETLDTLKAALKASNVPVMISPGNHDFCGPDSPWTEENWPDNVHIFTGGVESVALPELNCRVYGAGFQSMDSRSLLENFHADGEETYQLGLFHGDPVQQDSPYNAITASHVKHSGLAYLALGHIHQAGAFRAGDTICAWPGCPMGRGWDETGEKGVCIVTLDNGIDIRPVSLEVPRFYDLKIDAEQDAAAALERVLPAGGSKDFYRVTLTGYANVDMESLRKTVKGFPFLELLDQTVPPLDLWHNAGEDSLEGLYFQTLQNAMEANPDKADTIRRAAEISRKIMMGREVTL